MMSSSRFGAAAILLAACVDHPIAGVPPAQDKVEIKDLPAAPDRNVDLLFVIDDSGSMAAEQKSLQMNFPAFVQRLEAFDGGLPDLHIGIISTDVGTGTDKIPTCTPRGDDGRLLTNGCSALLPGATFLSDIAVEGGRQRDYTGALEDVFSCMANLGTSGCGAEQPLESLRLALDPARGANPGFVRDDSILAVVIISDEDDCSTRDRSMFTRPGSLDSVMFGCTEFGLTCDESDLRSFGDKHACRARTGSPYLFDVDDYVQLLQQLRPDPDQLVVAAITGQDACVRIAPGPNDPTAPALAQLHTCDATIGGAAYPAIRTRAFRDAFLHQAFTPIGDGDLTGGLAAVADEIKQTFPRWCLDGVPAQPLDCAVTDVQGAHTAHETQTVIAECDAAHATIPCWTVEEDDAQCADYPSKMKLTIDRGGAAPPSGTVVHAECVTQ